MIPHNYYICSLLCWYISLRCHELDIYFSTDPDKVTMDKSGSSKAAIAEINRDREVPIEVRRIK